MKAVWNLLHTVQKDVLEHYDHCALNAKKLRILGFEAKLGEPMLDGNTLLVNPTEFKYEEIYNLIFDYYNDVKSDNHELEEIVTVPEAAKLLGIIPKTVRKLLIDRKIPSFAFGKHKRMYKKDVLAYKASKKRSVK